MEIKGFAKVSRVPVCQRFILNHPTIHIRQLSLFAYISFMCFSPEKKKQQQQQQLRKVSSLHT